MKRRADTFDYRTHWPIAGLRQGDHRSSSTGDTGAYRGDRLLREAGDARRLSLRTSVRDPFERWWVREYLHHATLTLHILADVSRSMHIGQSCQVLSDLIRSAALSSRRIGDRFGVISAATEIEESLSLPASLNPAGATRLAETIAQLPQNSNLPGLAKANLNGAIGLKYAARRLGEKRSLVLVASDFHGPDHQWDDVFHSLRQHTVIPIVIWSGEQLLATEKRGLVTMTDAESGHARMVWMRPGLRRLLRAGLAERRERLDALFTKHRLSPVTFEDQFEAALLTERFHRGLTRRKSARMVSA